MPLCRLRKTLTPMLLSVLSVSSSCSLPPCCSPCSLPDCWQGVTANVLQGVGGRKAQCCDVKAGKKCSWEWEAGAGLLGFWASYSLQGSLMWSDVAATVSQSHTSVGHCSIALTSLSSCCVQILGSTVRTVQYVTVYLFVPTLICLCCWTLAEVVGHCVKETHLLNTRHTHGTQMTHTLDTRDKHRLDANYKHIAHKGHTHWRLGKHNWHTEHRH